MGAYVPSPGSARLGFQSSPVLAYLCYNGCLIATITSFRARYMASPSTEAVVPATAVSMSKCYMCAGLAALLSTVA